MTKKIRRHDLDWLRVLVFGLLIFYHVGMFFVPWGWHIKNNELYDWLVYPMRFLNQWRIPILFVISGMGTSYALSYRSGKDFRKERLKRLGIPLLIGMLLIVPPQVYIERIVNNQFLGSYFDYYFKEAFIGIYPSGNVSWHHLWFLPYLLLFSLLLSPLFLWIRDHPNNRFLRWLKKWIARPMGLYLFIIPLYFIEAFLEPFYPVTHALIGDWFALAMYGVLFFYGYLLITLRSAFWESVDKIKQKSLVTGVVSFCFLLWFWHQEDSLAIHFTEALFAVANGWSWILTIFGYAAKYLNRPSNLLKYCNEAVYPFYILHQTVTIILAFWMMNFGWSLFIKFTLLSVGTFLVTWLIYEFLIRRVRFLRPLFGLKNTKKHLEEKSPNSVKMVDL